MTQIELGDRVEDLISGSTGIVVGITRWITGCDTVTIEPKRKEDGSRADHVNLDITRVKVAEKGAVRIPQSTIDSPRMKGGPQPHVAPYKAANGGGK